MNNSQSTPEEPTSKIITLTPQLASELLARNPKNRKFSPTTRNYKIVLRAIRENEWDLNGEAIKVDTNGFMLDGQNRCNAVVQTGKPIRTFIMEGLPPHTQDTMDTGKSRSLADILNIHGTANGSALASIIRRVYIYEQYGLRAATTSSYPTTNKECLHFFEATPQIADLLPSAKKAARFAKIPASLAGMLIWVFNRIDEEDSTYFFDHLTNGDNLPTGDPILTLRNSLINLHDSKGTVNQTYLAALTVKAWNKFRAGEPLNHLRFTPGGANPEAFPEPK